MAARDLHAKLAAAHAEIDDLLRQRADLDERLRTAHARYSALVATASGANAFEAAPTQDTPPVGETTDRMRRPEGGDPRRVRLVRVLARAGGTMGTRELAHALGEDVRLVQFALGDLRHKEHALDKPYSGVWRLNEKGWELAKRLGD